MRFADHLRSLSPEALAELLTARPDLLPASDDGFTAIARRATTPMSLGQCLMRSDVGMLVVAEALAVLDVASAVELDELLGTGDVDAVVDALDRLRRRGVVTTEDGVAATVGRLDDLLHRPLGLGLSIVELWDQLPPQVGEALVALFGLDGASTPGATARAVAARMRRPAGLARLLEGAPEGTEEVLEALVDQRSPAIGLPAGHFYRDFDGYDPLTWMLDHGLLVAVNEGLAELPREVVMARSPEGLASGAVLRPIRLVPVTGLASDAVDAAGADQAGRALEAIEALLRLAADGQIALRRSGGVGVREVRRLAKIVDLEPRDVGRLIELATYARLLRPTAGVVAATDLATTWAGLPRPTRWLVLVRAWLGSPGFLSRALSRDDGGGTVPALGDTEPLAAAFACRQVVLDLVASLGEGEAYDPEQLTEAAVWRSPNLWGTGDPPPEELVQWTLDEATLLGLTALDGAVGALAALVAGDEDRLGRLASVTLGHDQSQIVVQSDLSAVALGPLDPAVAHQLSELSDRVSGLSVPTYRFTEASLRRGFDRGWTAAAIEAFIGDHALSGLPQPLTYLIADVDRRYGNVRVLGATAVIVTDDEATAVEIASTARAARLGLRLVAPTVLVGPVEPHRLVDELRAESLFPVLDGSTLRLVDGDRAPGSTPAMPPDLPADWTGPALAELALPGEVTDAVASLLAEDMANGPAPSPPGEGPVSELDRRLQLLWNRSALVSHLRGGELVEARGVLVGVDEALTLLNDSGIEEIPLDAVVSVEDPTR